ncbi:hypothetical protein BN59_03528 [Legionella massiliensis]|uniref:Uncharacterized protein n=1 Tax=Legionella massiliensis TaxID=1034943 RepID=A0A078KXQ8_9GAMM|nr:hypothetical protein [Legionella massiliensis]CDZ79210.1 hypothetical protein BN59_03528 [Legionella massiliensis]CEE14948.1 hypothetical protein BN1094_03528 [Legionella massiliensis]
MSNRRVLFTASALLLSATTFSLAEPPKDDQSINQLVRFLVSDKMLTLNDQNRLIPLSFYVGTTEDVAAYFGDFICSADNSCTVVDAIYTPFAILGRGLPPMDGTELEWLEAQDQIERTNIKYGTDIYHGATWQIALALAAKNGFLEQDRAKMLVANQLENITEPRNRAFGHSFLYSGLLPILDPKLAFSFRWLATSFYNKDPFFQGRFQDFISRDFVLSTASQADPRHLSSTFYSFVTTWSDQKPLIGKNAWAQLIGPLQAEYLLNNGKISADSPALVNAMNSLTAFSLMQSGIGAFYFTPSGTEGVQTLISPSDISIEDNFAVLAGLQILKHILQNTQQTAEVTQALARIKVMLQGGRTLNGFKTLGLLSFLYNGAFDTQNQIFFTNGTALIPSSINDWLPSTASRNSFSAVTTNLWALSALGVETIDSWFGKGTALKIWQSVRDNGGYFNNGQLWGMGYSLNNNVGSQPEAIMTSAGTAAAINALNSLIDFYADSSDSADFQADLASMQLNINNLRNDLYLDANFADATPREFFTIVPPDMGQAYLYASKRFPIPLDWNANTLASINGNAWVLMNNFSFNPFQYQGKLAGENYPVPTKVNILDSNVELPGGALPQTVVVHFTAGNLGSIRRLIVRYNMDGSQTNWIISAISDQREGFATIPQGAKAIAISFVNNDFANACEINPASDICIDNDCLNVKTISTHWSSNGQGSCDLN